MSPPTWNAVYEVLLRYGVDDGTAKHVAMNELRAWNLKDVDQACKRIQRPSRDYCLFRTDLTEVPSGPKARHQMHDVSREEYWPSLWKPAAYWISPPRHMMERAAKEKAALCVNVHGQFEVHTKGYVALSHVWIEGLQRDQTHHGIPQSKLSLIFDVLRRNGIAAEWVWTDALAIPAGGAPTAKLEDELLTTDVINAMPVIYSNAQTVVVLDALMLQLHPRTLSDVAAVLICGKWAHRVWTYQEIKLANEAVIITAAGAYRFADVIKYLDQQAKIDSVRFRRLWLALAIMARNDNVVTSFPDLAFACRTRKAGLDIDYVRAFFPALGLTWQAGTTKERGMHIIYTYYNIQSPTRIINFAGAPRLRLRPGWAPSTLVGLEGVVTDSLVEEKRGVRGDWYVHKLNKIIRTFTRHEKFVLVLEVPGHDSSPVQCVLVNESNAVVSNVTKAIRNGSCFILDAQHSNAVDAEFARQVLIAERAATEDQDGFEVAVHAAAVVPTKLNNNGIKQSILVRNGNPAVDDDLYNQIQYYWHTQDMKRKPSSLPQRKDESALHAAVRASDAKKVKTLLTGGEEHPTFDADGWTALHLAAARNDCHIIALFVQHKSEIRLEICSQNASQDTPLCTAAANGSTDAIRLLLNAGADLHARNKYRNTPLMAAACEHHTEAVCALLAAGADAKDRNQESGPCETALTMACSSGTHDIVPLLQALIDNGAEVNPEAVLGWTPLVLAVQWHPPDVVVYLLARGADANFQPQLHVDSPLGFALRRGLEKIVRSLLDAGADVNAIFNDGRGRAVMPIHRAVDSGNYTILQMLLEKNADVNAVAEPGGETALHLAVVKRHATMVKILLATEGCDRERKNATDITALDAARQLEDDDLVQILAGGKA
ncbi:MAG: hypothetical protein Q9165_008373 [Trypethelium subeluteriae]